MRTLKVVFLGWKRSGTRAGRCLLALIASAALLASAATPTWAGEGVTRLRDVYLAEHPGGVPLNATELSYGAGRLIITVARAPGVLASADCPSGWYCFYELPDFGYPRGKLSSCGFQDLGTYLWRNRVESVHYNLSTGSVSFINETGASDTTLFTASTSNRQLASVGTSANKADYVYRYC